MLEILAKLKQMKKSIRWLSEQTEMPYANVYDLVHGKRLPRSGELEKIEEAIRREEQK